MRYRLGESKSLSICSMANQPLQLVGVGSNASAISTKGKKRMRGGILLAANWSHGTAE